jgi:hypothetical protein
MARMRRWLTEALAEYRRHPRWAAAGLSVIAIALAAAGITWIMRQLATPPADAPAGNTWGPGSPGKFWSDIPDLRKHVTGYL